MSQLHVARTLSGKRILFTGVTGFVGKVTLSMLLHRYGKELERVWVLVRKGSAASAERRFFDKVAMSEPFDPLLAEHGGDEQGIAFLRQKVQVLDGDVTDPFFGLAEDQVAALKGHCDLVVNCAGLVSFNPSLEVGLNVNVYGVKNAADLCLHLGAPLLHMSTAFVAGNRSGLVFEDEEVRGYFPKRGEIDGRDFSLEQELSDCKKSVARWREMADDKALAAEFRQRALDRLETEGRDCTDEKALRLAIGRERKLWLSTKLTEAGMDRAQRWGWPNTYTYTKSLGEQVIVSTPSLRWSIVRPTIVESALHFPMPGWNEGFTTSAPLSFIAIKGHRLVPAHKEHVLDLVPVDQVAGATIAAAAATLEGQLSRVYHLASSDSNPFIASRTTELTGLYKRRHYQSRTSGNKVWNELMARVEPQAVSDTTFNALSAPFVSKGAKWLKGFIDEVRPSWGAPRLDALLTQAQERLDDVSEQADSLSMLIELFLPFLYENDYTFRCDHVRSLYAGLHPEDRAKIPWNPEAIDWRRYWLEVHMPGLEKFVFPGLEEETEKRRVIPTRRDLLELFESSVHAFRHRVAFRMVEGEAETRFTFGEVHRYAGRVGSFLLRTGVKPQERVLLVSENRPEWGMSYFGILRAGATAVPVDPQLSQAEVVNIARRARAAACLISEDVAESMPGLFQALAEAGLPTQLHSLAQAMGGDDTQPDGISPTVRKNASPDDVASLIFTSGTTGQPKGVMLTHRNFASLVAKLAGAFDIGVGDGLMSVLPLHHTFEFSCGFLMPFSRGAEITYLDDLTTDRLGQVFETGRVTAMIGVPALWQLLHRKITQELAAKPGWVEQTMKVLMSAHGRLRDRTTLNVGRLIFWPVHQKLGGKMKFMVSGGSALSDEVHKAFHELGFNITEGYGLTESAPVLAVAKVTNKRQPGTVGPALPGIEIKILDPDNAGIGEVIAKGPNVMAGYFEDREATDAVIKDGWLYTGDLGRLDDQGRLYLVGRKKDIIIDANGKNVYPDELEELYGKHAHVKELSIVGLPDEAGGEKVACLCVPDYKDRPREEVRRELEEHFRVLSAEMPFYRRVKLLRLWDGELPRTSTRKVKRKVVVEELKRLERLAASGEKAKVTVAAASGGASDWLFPLIAEVTQKPLADIRPEARLAGDLGLDSLVLTELSVALEQAGVPITAVSDLTTIQTVEDLRKLVAQSGRRPAAEQKAKELSRLAKDEKEADQEIPVPESVATLGRTLLRLGQQAMFEGVFDVQVSGKSFVPQNSHFLVAANHASHLDMGLVKVVLGEQGDRLTALAARDYFFDTPLKRAWFENMTNLIPMDRSGSLRESLRLAGQALHQGYNLLIFPEGTRSLTGEMAEFKPTLGYLALTHRVDVLPMYLEGTHDALPKGSVLPKRKALKVRIGPVLRYADLKSRTQGMARSEGYRYATSMVEAAVQALRVGKVFNLPEAKAGADAGLPKAQRGALP